MLLFQNKQTFKSNKLCYLHAAGARPSLSVTDNISGLSWNSPDVIMSYGFFVMNEEWLGTSTTGPNTTYGKDRCD